MKRKEKRMPGEYTPDAVYVNGMVAVYNKDTVEECDVDTLKAEFGEARTSLGRYYIEGGD